MSSTPRPPALPVPSALTPDLWPLARIALPCLFLSTSLSTGSLVHSFPVKFLLCPRPLGVTGKVTIKDWGPGLCIFFPECGHFCTFPAPGLCSHCPHSRVPTPPPALPTLPPPSQVPVPLSRVAARAACTCFTPRFVFFIVLCPLGSVEHGLGLLCPYPPPIPPGQSMSQSSLWLQCLEWDLPPSR